MLRNISKIEGIEELKKVALEKGDGIYLTYADHLACDAVTVITIRDGAVASVFEIMPGYGRGGIRYQFEKYLENNTDLPVYAFSASYFTYPQKWINRNDFLYKYIYSGTEEIEIPLTD